MASSHSGEDFHVRTLQGDVPSGRREPVDARVRERGHAARCADRRPACARRGEARRDPPHVLRAARRLAAAVSAQGLGPRDLLAAGASVAGRLPLGRRAGLRDDPGAAARPPSTAAGSRPTASASDEVAQAYAFLADPSSVPARDARSSLAPALDDRPRRHGRQPGDGRRAPRPTRHVADEGGRGSPGQQGRHGGAPRRSRSCPGRAPGRCSTGRRGWPSRSRTATATTAARGPRRSRRSGRSASSTGRRFGCWSATTDRPSSTRTVVSAQNRSRSSSSRPSAN